MSTPFAAIADTLTAAADAMENAPGLDPDGAVRQALWGHPDTPYPGDNAPGADLFDEAESAIECYIANQDGHDPGDGIDRIPPQRAIEAARAEAARFRSYC